MVSATLPTSVGILVQVLRIWKYQHSNTDTIDILYSSDTFILSIQYQPILDAIDLNIIMSGKMKINYNIASQLAMDGCIQ